MKKILILFLTFIIVAMSCGIVSTAFAEEEEQPLKGTVVITEYTTGDITADITEGEVGQIVTVTAKPVLLSELKWIAVNGTELIALEDGTYQFALVEGENVITAEFVINQEQVAKIVELYEKAKAGDWKDIFTMSNLSTLINWVLTIVFSFGYFKTLIKTKKIKADTINDFATATTELIQGEQGKAYKEVLTNLVAPLFDKLLEKTNGVEETMKVFTRCFLLMQENTPEARLAIIKELTNLTPNDAELSSEVKELIAEEVRKAEATQLAKQESIKKLEEANDAIKVATVEDKKEVEYGEI